MRRRRDDLAAAGLIEVAGVTAAGRPWDRGQASYDVRVAVATAYQTRAEIDAVSWSSTARARKKTHVTLNQGLAKVATDNPMRRVRTSFGERRYRVKDGTRDHHVRRVSSQPRSAR